MLGSAGDLVPGAGREEVTAVYAGLRAATEHPDYQIRLHAPQRYVCVGGIRSTGLTASMAIGEHVVNLLREGGLKLTPRETAGPPADAGIGEAGLRPYQDADRIAADPAYGRIVCHCERVTRGEIRDALASRCPRPTRRAAPPDPRPQRSLPGLPLRRPGGQSAAGGHGLSQTPEIRDAGPVWCRPWLLG